MKCWKISCNHSWTSLLLMSTFGSNKMWPLRILHKEQCITWGSSFLGTSSLIAAIFLGPHTHPILCHAISSFWSYLKGEVYKHRPCNLVELKMAIQEEIQQMTPAMTVRVINFRRCLNSCIDNQEYHMEDVVFHKWTPLTCEFETINSSCTSADSFLII